MKVSQWSAAGVAAALVVTLAACSPSGETPDAGATEELTMLIGSSGDAETTAVREVLREVEDDDQLIPVLLPAGDGLLCAKKEWLPEGD